MEYVKKTTMFFLRLTSLIFIVFTSVYSVSQNKCEMTIGSVFRYNFSVNIWKKCIKHFSSDRDQGLEGVRRLKQIMTRLDGILENSTTQLGGETPEQLSKLATEKVKNIEKVQAFIQRYFSVIDEFQGQYKELILFMNELTNREDTVFDRMGKLHFFDWQNRHTFGSSYLSFYYENLDWMKTTFKSIRESSKKIRSMYRELKKIEKFVDKLEQQT